MTLPVHTTLSRRQKIVAIELPTQPTTGGRHVVVDITGIKVYGDGEWKTRLHGVSKRRTWLKLHLGVNEQMGEILAAVVTSNAVICEAASSRLSRHGPGGSHCEGATHEGQFSISFHGFDSLSSASLMLWPSEV